MWPRRVAHEIKNPLTPIQLSAERLKRKYLKEVKSDPETFVLCTDTIIRHVADIDRMVDEFSDFARMPESVMKPIRLIAELQDLVTFQKAAHPDIEVKICGQAARDRELKVLCDTQQIRQALTNLIQNAVDSIQSKQAKEQNYQGQLNIIFHSDEEDYLFITVTDNGLGLPAGEDPSSLSEPYITHREKGTGLGLAIVKKIMSDHDGRLIIGASAKISAIPEWEDLGGASVSLVLPLGESEVEENTQAERKRA